MSTDALRIRDAITDRLKVQPWLTLNTVQNQPLPQLQPDELPGLLVVIMGESLTPDGDANAGPPRFEAQITIGISIVEGFESPEQLDGDIDEKITLIETALLTDPTFVRGLDPSKPRGHPDREPFFEAIERIQRRRLFPQDGETYFTEARLEIVFVKRVQYDPAVLDRYAKTVLTARLAGSSPNSPSLSVVIDQAQ